MSLIKNNHGGLGGSGAPGGALGSFFSHTIDNSARFSDASNTNLIFTPGTPSSTSVWTMSVWMKKYNPAASQPTNEFFSAGGGSAYTFFAFNASQYFAAATEQSGTKNKLWYNRTYRDPAAWFHLVLRSDLGQSTQADRLRLYINGELQTHTSDGITMSSWSYVNASGVTQNWGGKTGSANGNPGCDFYLADINFTDGQSYEPTEFGENSDGVWIPKDPSVTYGNNGYRLEFKQTGTGGASSSTIGADTSGNDNHFTDSGFDATDIGIPDTPTNNFATLNPIGEFYGESSNTKTFSEGNLQVAQSGGGSHDTATIAIETGHTEGYYWEVIVSSMDTARTYIGIVADDPDGNASLIASYGFTKKYILNRDGTFWGNNDSNASGTSSYTAYAQGNIVMVAYKNGKIWFGVNGTWMNSGDPANGTGFLTAQDGTSPSDRNQDAWLPYFGYRSTFIVNFGQNGTFNGTKTAQGNSDENGIGNFYYSVPSGFLALCTANLPDPTIGPGQSEQADDNFNTVLWTGNGTDGRTITGVNFAADWVWVKSRSVNRSHHLQDVVRGFNDGTKVLRSNASTAESGVPSDQYGFVGTINSDGYTLENGTSSGVFVNNNSETYVAWNWKAGGSASSNSNGSITSSVSANTDAGFSIGTFTGTGSAGTVGHGLSSAPDAIFLKSRGSTANWLVFHKDITDSPTHIMFLDATNANTDQSRFNDTNPTSSVFSVGPNNAENQSGIGYVFYCFHGVEGYSSFTSYHGNASTDGPMVHLGHRPAWILLKNDSASSAWYIFDVARNTYNVMDNYLRTNLSNAEGNLDFCDFVSNGFKIRSSASEWNGSGNKIIVFSFAEQPFKFANAR